MYFLLFFILTVVMQIRSTYTAGCAVRTLGWLPGAEKLLKNHKKVLTNVKQDTIIQRNSTVKCEEQDMTSS